MSSRRHGDVVWLEPDCSSCTTEPRPTHSGRFKRFFLQLPGVLDRGSSSHRHHVDGVSSWRSRRLLPANAALSAEKSRQTKQATSLV